MQIAFNCWTQEQKEQVIRSLTPEYEIARRFDTDYRSIWQSDSILKPKGEPWFPVWFKLPIDESTSEEEDNRCISYAIALAAASNFELAIIKDRVEMLRLDRSVRFAVLDESNPVPGEAYQIAAFGICSTNPQQKED